LQGEAADSRGGAPPSPLAILPHTASKWRTCHGGTATGAEPKLTPACKVSGVKLEGRRSRGPWGRDQGRGSSWARARLSIFSGKLPPRCDDGTKQQQVAEGRLLSLNERSGSRHWPSTFCPTSLSLSESLSSLESQGPQPRIGRQSDDSRETAERVEESGAIVVEGHSGAMRPRVERTLQDSRTRLRLPSSRPRRIPVAILRSLPASSDPPPTTPSPPRGPANLHSPGLRALLLSKSRTFQAARLTSILLAGPEEWGRAIRRTNDGRRPFFTLRCRWRCSTSPVNPIPPRQPAPHSG
jgi:hypothetical protein